MKLKNPTKNIPGRCAFHSAGCLPVSIDEFMHSGGRALAGDDAGGANNNGLYVVSLFMQRIYGAGRLRLVTGLVIVTAFASVFSLTLGYSRVPYAAALDGNYFRAFAKVHPVYRFPHVSLLALGAMAIMFASCV